MRRRHIAKAAAAREAAHSQTSTTASVNKAASKSVSVADPICLVCNKGYLLDSEEATMLSCKHFFHPGCIIMWLRAKNHCPVCLLETNLPDSLLLLEDDDDGGKNKDAGRNIGLDGEIIYDDDWKAMLIGGSLAFGSIVFSLLFYAYSEGVWGFN